MLSDSQPSSVIHYGVLPIMSEEHHSLIPNQRESSANTSHSSREASMSQQPEACNEAVVMAEIAASDRPCGFTSLSQDDNDSSQGETTANAALGEQHEPRESIESKSIDSKFALAQAHRRRRLFKAWWLETLACTMGLTALLALFGILYRYKDRPSPDWPKWMSLNTIVSAFVVVLKTSVLLVLAEGIGQLKWAWFTKSSQPLEHVQMWDDATRGPVGAFILLGRLRGKDLTASLGALIIVLILVVDPFTQQIIHYKDCPVPASGSAELPRTNAFSGGGHFKGSDISTVNAGVQNAINGGVFNPKPYASFDCATGNCTWSTEYSTVAWCSACRDISDQLKVTNISQYKHKGSIEDNGTITEYAGYLLNTSVQNGISVSVPYGEEGVGTIPLWTYAVMGPVPGDVGPEYTSGSIDFITGAKPPEICDKPDTAGIGACSGPMGSRCSLFPCVKTFNASAESGQLTEHLIDVGSEWFEGFAAISMLDKACVNSSDELRSLKNLGYKIVDGQRYLAYSMTANNVTLSQTPLTSSFIRQGCLYVVHREFYVSIADYFLTLLNGNVTGWIPVDRKLLEVFEGPQILQSFFNFGNATSKSIEETFHNISVSLTNFIRENGRPMTVNNGTDAIYSAPATGITMQYKICIGVRWGWLAYPATLVLLNLIFFGFLLAATWPSSSGLRIWKSSPLALLYHGLASWGPDQLDEKELRDLDEAEGMKQMAKSTSVRLEGSVDGLVQFVEQRKVGRQLI